MCVHHIRITCDRQTHSYHKYNINLYTYIHYICFSILTHSLSLSLSLSLSGYGNNYQLNPYGNYYTVTSLCRACTLGLYSSGGPGQCQPCNSISPESMSFYYQSAQTRPDCLCECKSHFPVLESGSSCRAGLTDTCLTNFGYFMYIAFGGVYQFSAAVIGIAVFFALVAYRRRISRLFEKEEKIVFRRVFYAKGGVNMGLQVRRITPSPPFNFFPKVDKLLLIYYFVIYDFISHLTHPRLLTHTTAAAGHRLRRLQRRLRSQRYGRVRSQWS